MSDFVGSLTDALRVANENASAATIEVGTVVSTSPLVLSFRGVDTGQGVSLAVGCTVAAGSKVLVARFGAGENIIFQRVT